MSDRITEAKMALDKIFKDVQDLELDNARLRHEREALRTELATLKLELEKWRRTRG